MASSFMFRASYGGSSPLNHSDFAPIITPIPLILTLLPPPSTSKEFYYYIRLTREIQGNLPLLKSAD